MRTRTAAAFAALLALAAAGAGLLRAQDGEVADGLPSLDGTWEGKFSMKSTGLAAAVEGSKLKRDCILEVQQSGANLIAVLTLPDMAEDTVYYLHGQVGNGSFWLQGDTSGFGTPMQIVGKATGSPGSLKMKASGVGSTTDSVLDVGLQAKQTVSTE